MYIKYHCHIVLDYDYNHLYVVTYLYSRSCFELLLSVSESELPCEAWVLFLQSLQVS